MGSSMRNALRAPADRVASSTARFSTPVTPEGTQTTTRGWAHRFWCTFWMKCRSICSVTSKSAMTPSLSGRMALMLPGRAPEHALGLDARPRAPRPSAGRWRPPTARTGRCRGRGRRRACWRCRDRRPCHVRRNRSGSSRSRLVPPPDVAVYGREQILQGAAFYSTAREPDTPVGPAPGSRLRYPPAALTASRGGSQPGRRGRVRYLSSDAVAAPLRRRQQLVSPGRPPGRAGGAGPRGATSSDPGDPAPAQGGGGRRVDRRRARAGPPPPGSAGEVPAPVLVPRRGTLVVLRPRRSGGARTQSRSIAAPIGRGEDDASAMICSEPEPGGRSRRGTRAAALASRAEVAPGRIAPGEVVVLAGPAHAQTGGGGGRRPVAADGDARRASARPWRAARPRRPRGRHPVQRRPNDDSAGSEARPVDVGRADLERAARSRPRRRSARWWGASTGRPPPARARRRRGRWSRAPAPRPRCRTRG